MNTPRLKSEYQERIQHELQKKLGLKNIMQVPKIQKIVLNVGTKEAVSDSKFLKSITDALEKIAGQKPARTIAHKSSAGFKIREGMPLGAKVTLRGASMYNFLDKFINLALPKVRDFQGVSPKFDRRGNYNVGIKEWTIFPELEGSLHDVVYGMNVTIQTSTQSDDQAYELLKSFGMPFKKS
jgi:large subunit ribosomal protein L5